MEVFRGSLPEPGKKRRSQNYICATGLPSQTCASIHVVLLDFVLQTDTHVVFEGTNFGHVVELDPHDSFYLNKLHSFTSNPSTICKIKICQCLFMYFFSKVLAWCSLKSNHLSSRLVKNVPVSSSSSNVRQLTS